MSAVITGEFSWRATLKGKLLLGLSLREYVKALVTPFNIIATVIIAVGIPVTWIRFTQVGS